MWLKRGVPLYNHIQCFTCISIHFYEHFLCIYLKKRKIFNLILKNVLILSANTDLDTTVGFGLEGLVCE